MELFVTFSHLGGTELMSMQLFLSSSNRTTEYCLEHRKSIKNGSPIGGPENNGSSVGTADSGPPGVKVVSVGSGPHVAPDPPPLKSSPTSGLGTNSIFYLVSFFVKNHCFTWRANQ